MSQEALGARYEALRELSPTAFAFSPLRQRWLVAAGSLARLRAAGFTDGVPPTASAPGQESGRSRPEVTWHRRGRPRVEEWRAKVSA